MYVGRLVEVIEGHRPEPRHLTGEQLQQVVASNAVPELRMVSGSKNGLSIRRRGNKALVVWGAQVDRNEFRYDYTEFDPKEGLDIVWYLSVQDDRLTYIPCVDGYAGAGSRGSTSIRSREALIKALGLGSVVIELPEPVVTLPPAPWNHSYAYDYGSGMVDDYETMFVSEARERVQPFIAELQEMVGLA